MSFDLDAVIAEEENGDQPEPFTFTFDKKKYTLPGRLDARAMGFIDTGRLDRAVQALAGPEQWAKIIASPKTLTLKTMNALLDAWVKQSLGLPVPKSSPSTARSKSTATRSKRTSRGSTASASPS